MTRPGMPPTGAFDQVLRVLDRITSAQAAVCAVPSDTEAMKAAIEMALMHLDTADHRIRMAVVTRGPQP